MTPHHEQIQAIQSMLAAGHRSVHLERHSLWIWGLGGGLLCALTDQVLTAERFHEVAQRGLALLVWLAFWLGAAAWLDIRLTRQARQQRDETLPFAQAQITRAWWMLLAVGCLGSFAMFFYGGGTMIYALWTVLLGLGIYFFGLFSRPLIEWIGLATILLGVAGLGAGLPYGTTRWLAASCFAIGMPLAGWLNARVGDAGLPSRVAALVLWLAVVVVPPLLISRYSHTPSPAALPIPLGSAALGTGEQVLRLEPGTRVPLRVDLKSPILATPPQAELALTLALPLEEALRDGSPDGRFRIGDGDWHEIHDGTLQLRISRLSPRLEGGQAVVRAYARFDSQELKGETP